MDYTTPKIAWIQAYDGGVVSKDHQIVLDELISRCVQVRKVDSVPSAVTRDDLCVGDFAFCKQALSKLGVAIPVACDYPECLSYLLYRRVWRSTLGEVGGLLLDGGKAIFIKPAVDLKAFSGLIATTDWISFLISEHSPQLPVLCSEVIKIAAEYRVYVVNAEIRACCCYMGEEKLDKTVVDAAVTALFTSSEGRGISAGHCGRKIVGGKPF